MPALERINKHLSLNTPYWFMTSCPAFMFIVHHLRPEVKNSPIRFKPFFVQSAVLECLSHMAEHIDGTVRASSVQFLSEGSDWPCHPSLKGYPSIEGPSLCHLEVLRISRNDHSSSSTGDGVKTESLLTMIVFAHQFHPGYPQLSVLRLSVSFQKKYHDFCFILPCFPTLFNIRYFYKCVEYSYGNLNKRSWELEIRRITKRWSQSSSCFLHDLPRSKRFLPLFWYIL